MAAATYRDRRHFEVALGRWRLTRWCEGAPCRLMHSPQRHPLSLIRARWSGRVAR